MVLAHTHPIRVPQPSDPKVRSLHHSPSPMRARHRLKSISFVAPCVPWPSRDLIWLVVTVAAAARNAGRQKAMPQLP